MRDYHETITRCDITHCPGQITTKQYHVSIFFPADLVFDVKSLILMVRPAVGVATSVKHVNSGLEIDIGNRF